MTLNELLAAWSASQQLQTELVAAQGKIVAGLVERLPAK